MATHPVWVTDSTLFGVQFDVISDEELIDVTRFIEGKIFKNIIQNDEFHWKIHHGDLTIDSNFENEDHLIVTGNLVIMGAYHDYNHREGGDVGWLVVLGSVHAEHFLANGGVYIQHGLESKGVVYAHPGYTESGELIFYIGKGIHAAGVIVDNYYEYCQYDVAYSHVHIGDVSQNDDRWHSHKLAFTYFHPDLYLSSLFRFPPSEGDSIFNPYPEFDDVVDSVYAGKPLFREQPAENVVSDLQAIEDGDLNRFLQVNLAQFDPVVIRRLTLEKTSSQLPDDVLVQLLNSPDIETGKHMVMFLPAHKQYLCGDECLENVELAMSAVQYNFDMPLPMMNKLFQHTSKEIRQAMAISEQFGWLAPDSIINEFLTSEDDSVRMKMTHANLSCEQACILAADNNEWVQRNLAIVLKKMKVSQKSSRMSIADIERVAVKLYERNRTNDELINVLLAALPESLQIQELQRNVSLIDGNFKYITSEVTFAFLCSHYSDPQLWACFAKGNKNIPLASKMAIYREMAKFVDQGECEGHKLIDILIHFIAYGEIDETLLMSGITCLDKDFNDPLFHAIITRTDLPFTVLSELDRRYRNGDNSWEWGYYLLKQNNLSREQIEWLVRDWFGNDDAIQALNQIAEKEGDAWWMALTYSEYGALFNPSLVNCHTPSSRLAELGAHSDLCGLTDHSHVVLTEDITEVIVLRGEMLNNPALTQETRHEWLAQIPTLVLNMREPDRSILRTLALTGKTWQIRHEAMKVLEKDYD